jgi:LysM repeat protein
MRNYLFLFAFFLSVPLYAFPGDTISYLQPGDTIFLNIGNFGEKYFVHEIAPKQTLYSLSRFYGLSVGELQYFNPELNPSAVRIGTPIRVPIPNRAIKRYKTNGFVESEHVPIYYVVKRGDTMFRIAKYHFKMPVQELMERNQMLDHTLSTGQMLHVGWLSIHGIPDSLRNEVSGPLAKKNKALKKKYLSSLGGKKEWDQQGVAAWKTESKQRSDFYALHRTAPINSMISVYNPMSRQTAYVKVVGRIPDTAYKDDVVVVLSPLAAQFLGAIDPRFFVRVKYHR